MGKLLNIRILKVAPLAIGGELIIIRGKNFDDIGFIWLCRLKASWILRIKRDEEVMTDMNYPIHPQGEKRNNDVAIVECRFVQNY